MRTHKHPTKWLFFPKRSTQAMHGILSRPLTVVEAPMGYGKTTAVKQYLHRAAGCVLWQTVYNNSIPGFWNDFTGLFGAIDAESSENLSRLGFPDDSVLMQAALKIMETVALPDPTVLVIDDYHLVETEATNRLIEFLTRNEISRLHIVVIARHIKLPSLEELKLKGFLHYVGQETLEFWPDDIVAYYQLCGIRLQDAEVSVLYSLTDGWISALYLLMLNFLAEGSFASTVNIYKLIEQSVYRPLSEEMKDFLLAMSIFDSFTPEQAAHMRGKKDTGRLLEEITQKSAFIKYDPQTKVYQLHGIFSNFLKDIQGRKEPRFQREIYRKAAEWCLGTGDFFNAMHYFYLYGEFGALLATFERSRSKSINSEHKEALIRYLEECPAEIRAQHHLALLIYAIRLYTFNERELFQKTMAEVLRNIQADPGLEAEAQNQLLGEYELILSFTKYNDIRAMSAAHLKAGRLMSRPTGVIDENGVWTFGSPSVLYLFYRESGRLEQHVADMIEAMPHYYRLTNGHGAGAEQVMRAEYYFYRGDFVNAEIEAHQALFAVQAKRQTAIAVCAVFLQSRLALLKGDLGMALGLLDELRADVLRHREYIFLHTLDLCETYLYLAVRQPEQAAGWIARGEFGSSRLFFPAAAMNNIIYGKLLLVKGEYLKLIGGIGHFNSLASIFPNLLAVIYNQIHLAAANEAIARRAEALEALAEALRVAAPDQMLLPFVENGDYLGPLLDGLSRDGLYGETIARIKEMYARYQTTVEQMIGERCARRQPSLTGRETEIARLVAEGLSNREIGRLLFISENTVKTQLKSVFKKLGIAARTSVKDYLNERAGSKR